ncbi:FAD-dependent monooxygenase, partial [Leptospira sp. SA-E8]|uniref:FAD-dependent monooxygenase n=1 Tax=Leptospira sp. SA-E8 TaxID=3422259 RepID=UPI003EB88A54
VTVWLGPKLHVVSYPVRGGESLNVVAIVQNSRQELMHGALEDWDHAANAEDLRSHLAHAHPALQDLIAAIPAWRLWMLCDRRPLDDARQMAHGRVALVGDAAHPMLPYLAQGAGMAIEDAAELERLFAQAAEVGGKVLDLPVLLHRYALNRWQRNARVQQRAIRNGNIFHLSGPMAWARDSAMRLLGERLLDLPWLYRGA